MDDDRTAPAVTRFDPEKLIRSVIALPLLAQIAADESALMHVIIDVNIRHRAGRQRAKERIPALVQEAIRISGDTNEKQGVHAAKSVASQQYVYGHLQGKVIRTLVVLDQKEPDPVIFHVWPDFIVSAQIWKSVPTVKADACRRAFDATGRGILWAVLDSGIEAAHPHFAKHRNLLDLPGPVQHTDFTGDQPVELKEPLDDCGHGTHVAGIIAGELEGTATNPPVALLRQRDPAGLVSYQADRTQGTVFGVAPECKLVSFKVLDNTGHGPISNVIAAIEKIHEINSFGRHIVIHGVNLSMGYDFDAEWFACGQSPVCTEVDRLVRSGVCVVAAAGNTGQRFDPTINDPGNAEMAITVGATHRDMPHMYGVSYFSSKGPTGDGRRKPDLLAPGERIISCGAGPDLKSYMEKAAVAGQAGAYYMERSGTSQAAPHVSGIIAGLLSIRSEFIGQPEVIKKLLMDNAVDLGRDPSFQGRGLADMMRLIQAI